jgi:hypothetical protein
VNGRRCRRMGGAICLRGCTHICAKAAEAPALQPVRVAPKPCLTDASGAPILSDPIAIQNFVEADCGAEGFTIHKGRLHAVRWVDGVARTIKVYEVDVKP